MLSIGSDQIHLWYVFLDQIFDKSLLAEYESLLSDCELFQMKKFIFLKDKLRFLITRVLVRTTLSKYEPITPQNWIFKTTSNGKPFISNNSFGSETLSFNLAHTQGLILLGITRSYDLGVDVEAISPSIEPLDIAKENFANDEIAFLQNLSKMQQLEYFYRYWTLKESYIKARGCGLSIPLNLFSFQLHKEAKISWRVDNQLNESPFSWKFWQFKPTYQHMASVCISNLREVDFKIKIKKIVPLRNESEVNGTIFLSS